MEKDLRKLNRTELVEIVYRLRVELDEANRERELLSNQQNNRQLERMEQTLIERLEAMESVVGAQQEAALQTLKQENAELKEKLARRAEIVAETGSIAEATVQLTDLFAHAQDTAEAFLENVRKGSEDGEAILRNAETKAAAMLQEAEEKAGALLYDAEEKAGAMLREAESICESRFAETDQAVAEKWEQFQQQCNALIEQSDVLRRIMGK